MGSVAPQYMSRFPLDPHPHTRSMNKLSMRTNEHPGTCPVHPDPRPSLSGLRMYSCYIPDDKPLVPRAIRYTCGRHDPKGNGNMYDIAARVLFHEDVVRESTRVLSRARGVTLRDSTRVLSRAGVRDAGQHACALARGASHCGTARVCSPARRLRRWACDRVSYRSVLHCRCCCEAIHTFVHTFA